MGTVYYTLGRLSTAVSIRGWHGYRYRASIIGALRGQNRICTVRGQYRIGKGKNLMSIVNMARISGRATSRTVL